MANLLQFPITGRASTQLDQIREILMVVDSIHWCANLKIETMVSIADFEYESHKKVKLDPGGKYDWVNFPPDIVLFANLPDTRLVFLHELGHFLDHWFIDLNRQFASREGGRQPDMQDWFDAVQSSATVKKMQARLPNISDEKMCEEIRDYVLRPEELWACSYAQYIAEEYGTDQLRKELDHYRRPGLVVCRHWPKKEFKQAGIKDAVKNVFAARGWLQ